MESLYCPSYEIIGNSPLSSRYQGILGSCVGGGNVIGPFLAAAFIEKSIWRGLLCPLAVTSGIMVLFILPGSKVTGDPKDKLKAIDLVGIKFSTIANLLLLIPISGGGTYFQRHSLLLTPLLPSDLLLKHSPIHPALLRRPHNPLRRQPSHLLHPLRPIRLLPQSIRRSNLDRLRALDSRRWLSPPFQPHPRHMEDRAYPHRHRRWRRECLPAYSRSGASPLPKT